MGRKSQYTIEEDYSSDENDELEQEEQEEYDEYIEDMNKTVLIDNYNQKFDSLITYDFLHLSVLGAGFVYDAIINEYRPFTARFVFSNKIHPLTNNQYQFWYDIFGLLNKPTEKIPLIHYLIGTVV